MDFKNFNTDINAELFTVFIEISKNSKQKYELDEKTGFLKLDRILSTSTHYPANYGFIPNTLSEDNDPLDVLVLCSETLMPTTIVDCIPIGVVIMNDNGEMDEKIIAVPKKDPHYNCYKSLTELPEHVANEIVHFFSVYKQLEGKVTRVDGTKDRNYAIQIINKAIEKHKHIQQKNK